MSRLGGKATMSAPVADRTEIDYTTLHPITDTIVFTWVDEQEDEFVTTSGIVVKRTLDKTRQRWGLVVAVGPLSQAVAGQYILPANANNPFGGVYCGLELWACKDKDVIVMSDDKTITQVTNE